MTSATEEASRNLYDDVDDFHCLRADGATLRNILNQSQAATYRNYQVAIFVSYDGSRLGLQNNTAKRVEIQVTTPGGEPIVFTGFKGNW
jgi:MSHA pilin protein MshD